MRLGSKPDSQSIQKIFDGMADRYNLFNRLTSFGLDNSWRRKALEPLQSGMRVLDLGCGTGDLCLAAAKKLRGSGEVTGLDFSPRMLEVAQKRYDRAGAPMNGRFKLVARRAEELPLGNERYDLVVSGFVLRNIYENIDEILRGVRESLREGGQISFLDFTEPPGWRAAAWKLYMNTVVALYGKALFGERFPQHYMTDSAARFLKADEFVEKLKQAGFESVRVQKFLLGVIVLYRARKP